MSAGFLVVVGSHMHGDEGVGSGERGGTMKAESDGMDEKLAVDPSPTMQIFM